MKILVVKPTALGDVAQALLVAPLLRHISSCSELVWLVDEDYQSLVRCSPLVDRLILFPRKRWRRKWMNREWINWLIKLRREGFDLVIDLQGLARSAVMTWATGAPRRLGLASAREGAFLAYTEIVMDTEEHAVDRYAQAVAVVSDAELPLTSTYLDQKSGKLPANLVSGEYTVLHPYSLWASKLWNWQNYESLIRSLSSEIFVLIGQGTFFPVLADNCVDLRNQTTLDELLLILSHSRMVISTDSGPLHLAAAFGRPVIGLFGATSEFKTGARSKRGIMLSSTDSGLSKSHRQKYPETCLLTMTVSEVLSAWQELTNPVQK
jgi:heptosyltransferase I